MNENISLDMLIQEDVCIHKFIQQSMSQPCAIRKANNGFFFCIAKMCTSLKSILAQTHAAAVSGRTVVDVAESDAETQVHTPTQTVRSLSSPPGTMASPSSASSLLGPWLPSLGVTWAEGLHRRC